MELVYDRNGDREQVFPIHPEFVDERGSITNLFRGLDFSHCAIITSVKGSVRGNHVHPEPQWMYIISGLVWSVSGQAPNPDGTPEERYPLVHGQEFKAGDLVYCPPNIAHAYQYLEDTIFLNFTVSGRASDRFGEHTTPVVLLPHDRAIEAVRAVMEERHRA